MSVFTFRGDAQRDRARIEIAKNGVKRLKTIRHPNVLLMKETVEIESGNEITIHVVTEATTPLEAHLREAPPGTEAKRDDYYALGLREIATAVSFLNNDCKLAVSYTHLTLPTKA